MIAEIVNGKAKLFEIENRALRNMEGEQLVGELERVERELRFWRLNCMGRPAWYRRAPYIRSQYNCLQSARRRIGRELKRRVEELEGQLERTGAAHMLWLGKAQRLVDTSHVAANEAALECNETHAELEAR